MLTRGQAFHSTIKPDEGPRRRAEYGSRGVSSTDNQNCFTSRWFPSLHHTTGRRKTRRFPPPTSAIGGKTYHGGAAPSPWGIIASLVITKGSENLYLVACSRAESSLTRDVSGVLAQESCRSPSVSDCRSRRRFAVGCSLRCLLIDN